MSIKTGIKRGETSKLHFFLYSEVKQTFFFIINQSFLFMQVCKLFEGYIVLSLQQLSCWFPSAEIDAGLKQLSFESLTFLAS